MPKYTIVGEQIDEYGHKVDNCYSVLYGEEQVEHLTLASAIATLYTLRTTGDWPDGRPHYWIEDEDGVEQDVEEMLETMAIAKDLFKM